MTTPPYLKKGDKIGIAAPARKISKEEIQFAVDTFEKWGLEVVLGKNLFGIKHQYSGSDEQRTEDLQKMLDDNSIKAIISARGGYGTLRIIDELDFKKFQETPKWIIGYSDITVLHSHIHQNFEIETLHATMPINFSKDEESVESLRKNLFAEEIVYKIGPQPLNRKGNAEGELVGGNLSLLYALKGSKSGISTSGKILFIEDLDEYLYHIDRMIISLKRSGMFSHLAGLIVGGMTDMKDNSVPFGKTAEQIISDVVKEFDYPVCFGFPAGHAQKNLALLFGRRAKLKVADGLNLSF
ncbi:MAG: LD-carboxypeptidase [Bacteroidetes bacterium]|nr:LD-carboxypeptidase [Bacteroidota bacterium]